MARQVRPFLIAGLLSVISLFGSLLPAAAAAPAGLPARDAQAPGNVIGPDGAPQAVPDKVATPLTILVSDQAKALGPAALSHLKSAAATAAANTGARFYIYILNSVNNELGEAVAAKKAAAQGLSQGRDSVLMLISMKEKQGWLWTSPQLDETMGPGVKQAVLDYIIEPNLERGDVLRAASDGTRALSLALEGVYKHPRIEVEPGLQIPGIPDGALPGLLLAAFVAMMGGGGAYSAVRGLRGRNGGNPAAGPNILSRIV